jgi:hypothetical protein
MGWFGKKKTIDDRLIFGISLEVAMYDWWCISNGHNSILTVEVEQADDIIARILKRENLPADRDTIFMIKMEALGVPVEVAKEIYDKENFESQVPEFCSSIGIPLPESFGSGGSQKIFSADF